MFNNFVLGPIPLFELMLEVQGDFVIKSFFVNNLILFRINFVAF